MASPVGFHYMLDSHSPTDTRPSFTEEFNTYLNYVRKLAFEETPEYDFLQELFAKVMKNNGDIDDQVYDWNLLNGIPPRNIGPAPILLDTPPPLTKSEALTPNPSPRTPISDSAGRNPSTKQAPPSEPLSSGSPAVPYPSNPSQLCTEYDVPSVELEVELQPREGPLLEVADPHGNRHATTTSRSDIGARFAPPSPLLYGRLILPNPSSPTSTLQPFYT